MADYSIIGGIKNFSHTYMSVSGKFDANLVTHITDMENLLPGKSLMHYRGMVPNLFLIIELKIELAKADPNGPSKPALDAPFTFGSWPQADWEYFKKDFVWFARRWSNRFHLVLKDSGRKSGNYKLVEKNLSLYESSGNGNLLVCPRVISCVLLPVIVENNAHARINVWYILDKNGKALNIRNCPAHFPMRSDASNISNADVCSFNTIPHEVGHLLGLPHVGQVTGNPACVAPLQSQAGACSEGYNLNNDPCYQDRFGNNEDIMGGGDAYGYWNAYPWKVALREITGIPVDCYKVETSKVKGDVFEPAVIEHFSEEWWAFNNSQPLNGYKR